MLSQNEDGQTKLYEAAHYNRMEEAKKMMKEANNLNIASELVNKGDNNGNIITQYRGNNTPLHWASYNGHLQMAQLLLNNGAEIDKVRYDGSTPLIIASRYGHLEVVKLLIEHQADVQLKTKWGETALYYARKRGRTAIEKALEEAGAK